MAKTAISTIRKMSGAKRARKPKTSISWRSAASGARLALAIFSLPAAVSAALALQRHHRHQDFLRRLGRALISPVTRPSRMVTMRSLIASTSGSSEEMAMTAMPGSRHVEEKIVHLDLGADIDAARRLVDDQHLGPERQPAGQHDLLLVAAGQVGDQLLRARHADVERLAILLDQRVARALSSMNQPQRLQLLDARPW